MSAAVELETHPRCAHCSEKVPAGFVVAGADRQFCCAGCHTVFDLLHEQGLDAYYEVRARTTDERRTAKVTGRDYAELDEPTFAELYVRATGRGLATTELYLEGVHCAACLWLVEKLPRLVPGVVQARLDFGKSCARVVWDPTRVTLSAVARGLDRLGYAPHPYRGVSAREQRRREDRAFLIRIGVAGAVFGNVMLLAVALYSGMFAGIEHRYEQLFRWMSLVVTIPSVFWAGNVFLKGAWSALRTRTPHIDLPVSIGILAGFFWGAWNTLRASGEIYFDSVAALIFFLLVGRFLQRRQQRAAADSTELMHAIAPQIARLLEDTGVREVPLAAVVPGMRLEVRAGDTVPVDGLIEEGASSIDASLLTGESLPVEVQAGHTVHAGTLNVAARLVVRATATGETTRVGRLLALVQDAAQRRAPTVLLADRLSAYFVYVSLGAAAATAAWWWSTDPTTAIDHAVALLIVTCPCALGLATPLAFAASLGRAAHAGLLIKGGDALERLARPATVFFDKTGTLTKGELTLTAWHGDERVKPLVVALEREVAHPIARAVVRSLGLQPALTASEVHTTVGAGIEGVVDGRRVHIGSPKHIGQSLELVEASGVQGDAGAHDVTMLAATEQLVAAGRTPVWVAVDGKLAAVMGFGDPPRDDARTSLAALMQRGYAPRILSGDHARVVQAVAKELGIAAHAQGGASPEAKLAVVKEAKHTGPVVMVGDGVNDAAALSAADVGIAVHGGAEASLAVADVYVTKPGVAAVVELVEGAKRTMRTVRRAMVFSIAYNLAGLTMAVTGTINPLIAAILMPLSSITVVLIAYKARSFEPHVASTRFR